MSRTRRARIAIALCALLLAAIALLVAQRRSVARALIDAQLRSLGLEEIGHEVERLGLAEFGVRDFRIGGDLGLRIDRIDARYSPSSLLAGRLEELSVRGVRLTGAFEDGRLTFGALDPALRSSDRRDDGKPGGARSLLALPARSIAIEDFEITVATPEGPFDGSLTGSLRELEDRRISANAVVRARHPLFEGDGELDVAGTLDSFRGALSLELRSRPTRGGGGEDGAGADEAEPRAVSLDLAAAISGSESHIDVDLAAAPLRLAAGETSPVPRIDGEIPAMAVSIPRPVGSAAIVVRTPDGGGHLGLPDLGLALADISLDVALDPDSWLPNGDVRIASVSDTRAPARFAPGMLTGAVTTTASSIDFDLRATDPGEHYRLAIRGAHSRGSGQGEARLQLEPVEFVDGGLQPGALSPSLGESIQSATGKIEALGAVHWGPDTPSRASFDFVTHDLSVTTELGSFERLNAAFRVDGPSPYTSPPRQLLSMARIDFGLDLTNGLIALRLRPDGRIDVESAEWSLAGGKIRTSGVIDPFSETQRLVLRIDGLDLAKLLELADLDGLSGSGLLSGEIPVVRRGSKLEIKDGKLSGIGEGGWVRYRSSSFNQAAVGAGQDMNVVFQALENFHYDVIEATLDGDTDDVVVFSIRLKGANPDFLEGHPIDFTLNVESRLVDLLRKATAVYRIPEEIQHRIEELSGTAP